MSPELETSLRFFGWFPGRRVDDAQVAQWLRAAIDERGCHLFPEAVRIYREFGGLTLPHHAIRFGLNEDPGNGLPLSPQDVHEEHLGWLTWEWQLNEILFPIGYELREGGTFAVSSTGKIFYWGDSIHHDGDSIEDFLEGKRYGSIESPPERDAMWSEVERLYSAVYGLTP